MLPNVTLIMVRDILTNQILAHGKMANQIMANKNPTNQILAGHISVNQFLRYRLSMKYNPKRLIRPRNMILNFISSEIIFDQISKKSFVAVSLFKKASTYKFCCAPESTVVSGSIRTSKYSGLGIEVLLNFRTYIYKTCVRLYIIYLYNIRFIYRFCQK